MPFHTEPRPAPCTAMPVAPGVLRATCDNPGKMTYHGTNTYLIEDETGLYILDPGAASDERHLTWLGDYVGGRAAGIIVTHHHADHFGLALQLRSVLDVPIYAHARFVSDTFTPDVALGEGDRVAGLEALHTPGHASDHLCFARADGIVFTGDHIMTWNSSIVAPPDGDMAHYCAQLQRMLDRDDRLYLPGHGPPLPEPATYTRQLLRHRERREQSILDLLAKGTASVDMLADRLYRKTDPHLVWAARRNVEAHLSKLQKENVVVSVGQGEWSLNATRGPQ